VQVPVQIYNTIPVQKYNTIARIAGKNK